VLFSPNFATVYICLLGDSASAFCLTRRSCAATRRRRSTGTTSPRPEAPGTGRTAVGTSLPSRRPTATAAGHLFQGFGRSPVWMQGHTRRADMRPPSPAGELVLGCSSSRLAATRAVCWAVGPVLNSAPWLTTPWREQIEHSTSWGRLAAGVSWKRHSPRPAVHARVGRSHGYLAGCGVEDGAQDAFSRDAQHRLLPTYALGCQWHSAAPPRRSTEHFSALPGQICGRRTPLLGPQ
jgi:hypothetical protein